MSRVEADTDEMETQHPVPFQDEEEGDSDPGIKNIEVMAAQLFNVSLRTFREDYIKGDPRTAEKGEQETKRKILIRIEKI